MMRRNQAGFTMVEVLVAVSVTTIIVLVITDFMMRNIQTSTLETSKAAILREVQLSLDEVNADIRLSANADLVNRNADNNSPGGTANVYGWTSNASTLVLATAATNTSGAIIFSDAANYITTKNNLVYFVSGGTLYRRTIAVNTNGNSARTSCPAAKVSPACPPDKELLHNVKNFSIRYVDGDSNSVTATSARAIELSLTASKTQYKQTQSASYTTRMVFRND